mgnify:FL=1
MPSEKVWTRNFLLIILINFLVFMNHIMVLSTFPMFLEQVLGLNEAVAGAAAFAFSAVAVILRPIIGWLLDCGRRRGVLLIGLTSMLLMPLGYAASAAFTASGYVLTAAVALALVCRMLHGAALAFSNTTGATIASDALPQKRFAEGMGYFGMATALATSLAPALGLALMKVSFTVLFLTASGFMLISLLLCLMMKPLSVPQAEKKPLEFKTLIDADAVPASVICLVFLLTWGALENFLADYAIKNSLPSGGIFFAITAVMLFLVRVTIGKLADKKGEGIFVYSCNAALLAAFLLLAFAPGNFSFYLAAVLAGYAFGGIEPALQSMAVHIAPPERRGSANSTFLCAYDIGLGGGGGIAGVLISALGYRSMYLILSLATVVSVLLYVFWGRHHRSSFSRTLK